MIEQPSGRFGVMHQGQLRQLDNLWFLDISGSSPIEVSDLVEAVLDAQRYSTLMEGLNQKENSSMFPLEGEYVQIIVQFRDKEVTPDTYDG